MGLSVRVLWLGACAWFLGALRRRGGGLVARLYGSDSQVTPRLARR